MEGKMLAYQVAAPTALPSTQAGSGTVAKPQVKTFVRQLASSDSRTTLAAFCIAAPLVAGRRRPGVRPNRSRCQAVGSRDQSSGGHNEDKAMPYAAAPVAASSVLPGDIGFDPLGLASFEGEYVDEVLKNFNVDFDRMRWYREAELMHGRVAMLAALNLLLRETFLSPALPDQLIEVEELSQFVQIMAILEAYRGYRLFVNTDQVAGDLGLGSLQGPTDEELAERQSKELQNSRVAMLAVAGMAAQYQVTGRAVGIDAEQVQSLESYIYGLTQQPQTPEVFDVAFPITITALILDGVRRLSTSNEKKEENTIKQKSINFMKMGFGMQDPGVALPSGVIAGQAPQQLMMTEAQIKEYEENGVIMIKGGMKAWVEFLQKTTEYQIENPHFWSLVGRVSGLYDYIQRNTWMTNNGFRDFLYYSPLGHILSQLGRTEEIRVSTDMLLVNPNKGFGWHQDNQNGPIDFPDAMRWWVAMDPCGQDGFGAPEYLLGSHRNKTVSDEAVFVEREAGDLGDYQRSTTFIAEPGDLIIWDARCIHRIVAPPGQFWEEGTSRRAIGGTVAKAGTIYFNKGGASGISDLAGHNQVNGEVLGGPYFPRIWPDRIPEEEKLRAEGKIVGRSPAKMVDLAGTLASNAGKYVSFTKVVGKRT